MRALLSQMGGGGGGRDVLEGGEGGGGGRDVLEGGGGGGSEAGEGGLAGTPPPPRVPLWSPPEAGQKFEAQILLAPKAPKQNFGCQASKMGKGGGGGGNAPCSCGVRPL